MTALPNIDTGEDMHITIADNGVPLHLTYTEVEQAHQGDSWFGCAVGFRAMQLAARELSASRCWSRQGVYIVSGHPGDGVRDAIEAITHAVSQHRFALLDASEETGCHRGMKFEWWASEHGESVHIRLRDDMLADNFYPLLDRAKASPDDETVKEEFHQLKLSLRENIWRHSLDQCFVHDSSQSPLSEHHEATS